ncbi:MAG: serine kinase [bacterium]
MKLSEIISGLGLEVISPGKRDVEVAHGYASDLLSDVIANAGKDYIWVTMQTHVNVIAVASLKDIAAVVVVGGRKLEEATVEVARTKGVCVLGTKLSAFDVTGKLYASGLT